MVKKPVIWSPKAQENRLSILDYWIDRTKSKAYASKLYLLFNQAAQLIAQHPEIGKPTNLPNIRFKIVREYLIFYENQPERIEILLIWDSRQNPAKLPGLLA